MGWNGHRVNIVVIGRFAAVELLDRTFGSKYVAVTIHNERHERAVRAFMNGDLAIAVALVDKGVVILIVDHPVAEVRRLAAAVRMVDVDHHRIAGDRFARILHHIHTNADMVCLRVDMSRPIAAADRVIHTGQHAIGVAHCVPAVVIVACIGHRQIAARCVIVESPCQVGFDEALMRSAAFILRAVAGFDTRRVFSQHDIALFLGICLHLRGGGVAIEGAGHAAARHMKFHHGIGAFADINHLIRRVRDIRSIICVVRRAADHIDVLPGRKAIGGRLEHARGIVDEILPHIRFRDAAVGVEIILRQIKLHVVIIRPGLLAEPLALHLHADIRDGDEYITVPLVFELIAEIDRTPGLVAVLPGELHIPGESLIP